MSLGMQVFLTLLNVACLVWTCFTLPPYLRQKRLAQKLAKSLPLPVLDAEEWIDVFRETVIAAEGYIPEEIGSFLIPPKELRAQIQTLKQQALAQAEKEVETVRHNALAVTTAYIKKVLDDTCVYKCSDDTFAKILFAQANGAFREAGLVHAQSWVDLPDTTKARWRMLGKVVRQMVYKNHAQVLLADVPDERVSP